MATDLLKKSKIPLLVCACISAVALAYIAFMVQAESQMVFPQWAQGTFIQNPSIRFNGNTSTVAWVLPQTCDSNSYEVREEGYVRDAGMLWGGEGASCAQTEKGFACQAAIHPGMKHDGRRWVLQAYGHGCAGNAHYVSKPMIEVF